MALYAELKAPEGMAGPFVEGWRRVTVRDPRM
jgi:hypothetical protein